MYSVINECKSNTPRTLPSLFRYLRNLYYSLNFAGSVNSISGDTGFDFWALKSVIFSKFINIQGICSSGTLIEHM